jgi:hypothetical protein
MVDLRRSLVQHDGTLLRVIGETWGIDLTGLSLRLAAERLAHTMLASDLPAEIADLSAEEQSVIQALQAAGGRILADSFFRQFGTVRPFGPGRLARERPWDSPASPAEALWYRGLIFRAFEQTDMGSQEYVYLPDEIRAALPPPSVTSTTGLHLAAAAGPVTGRPLAAGLVDDCCTLLAYVQQNPLSVHPHPALPVEPLMPYMRYKDRARLQMIWMLALEAGLLTTDETAVRPHPQVTRAWLQSPHPEQAATLVQTWLDGSRWNDLWQVPSLRPEPTGWQNDPCAPRRLMLDLLAGVDSKTWWSLDGLLAGVKASNPDFLRAAGDYDTWYIRDATTGEYLNGFGFWDRVEGALLRFLVTGPLAWLEMVELGEDPDGDVIAFRPTPAGRAFAQVRSFPYPAGPAEARIRVYADATISVPASVSRFTRFQVARLADWEPLAIKETIYRYRLTPRSLARARRTGIALERALSFLASRSGRPLPEPVRSAVEAWEEHGAQIQLREVKLLQVRDEAVLDRLRAAPNVRPLLGEAVGPLAVIVRTTDWSRLISAIAELGLLSEVEDATPAASSALTAS